MPTPINAAATVSFMQHLPALGVTIMRKIVVALAAAALFAAGCSGNQGRGNPALKPVDKNAPADMVVKNAVETRANLSSIAGKGVMRIVDRPNNFGLTVNADVVADEGDRLRIKADKLAGAIQAFDVVKLGDDIGFYVPTQKVLYHGKVEDLRYFTFRFDPDDVLRQMLRAETSLLLKRWRYIQGGSGDSKNAILVEEAVPAGRPRLRVAINRSTGMIMSIAQLDAGGEPVLVKSFDDYRSLQRGRRGAPDEPVFPFLMTFSWPRDRRMMEMHFKTVEGNAILYDEDFDIAASSDTRYLPLLDAHMDGSLGDEPLAAGPQPAEKRVM